MSILLVQEWWINLNGVNQISWTIAVIATLLLVIFYTLDWFSGEEKADVAINEQLKAKRSSYISQLILLFGLAFGWTAVLLAGMKMAPMQLLVFSVCSGIITIIGLVFRFQFIHGKRLRKISLDETIPYTGQVLQSIPPNKNGVGKIQLDGQVLPYAIKAATKNGAELPIGAPVRAVALEGRVVIVEPIEENDRKSYPGQIGA